tara:strand:- start:1443 stop:3671 length:2229 start_codon:yes stop_codon:yes gene_type:complete
MKKSNNFSLRAKLLVYFFLSFAFESLSQNKDIITPPSFEASYLETPPILDGNILSDPSWVKIKPITNLKQARPFYGSPASEKTEIRIAFTNKTLYVGVICFDKESEKIVVSDSRRDSNLNDDDSFLFILDTYNDQQNGFLFGTNSIGVEYDAQIDNEGEGNMQQGGVVGGTNLNWDASWDVKTETGDYGWSAEFAIPLRTLRFGNGKDKTWGVNFQRNISKNSEVAYWAQLPIAFEIKRLSLAGKMKKINLKNPKNLKIFPYGLTQNINDKSNDSKYNNQEYGLDIKYSLTPGLTLDMTYNTDFAQVEVDEQQVNLDRFNLFFPEKRAFFLENAGQFSVGSPGEVDLFFSRRIGLSDDGSVVPIIGGSRISGKIGQTNIGLLNMYTDEVQSEGIGKNNFTVARVNHDFAKSRSSIGGIYINKSEQNLLQGANGNSYNRVAAIDGKWGLGKKGQVTGFISKSSSPNINSDDHALNFKAEYAWDGWRIFGAYTEVGEGFNPEVGFLLRDAFKKPEFLIFKQWRPKNTGNFLEVRPHISGRRYFNFNNDLISSFLHVDNHWVWKSGFEIHTGVNFTTEGVFNDFSISGVTIPSGEYNHQEFQLIVYTNKNNQIYYSTRTFIGGYYGGNRFSSKNTINLRVGDKFNSALTINYNKLNLQNGTIDALITGGKFTYSFTPRIFLQSLIQYNNISNITSVNTRFGWLKNANTGLFVVLNLIEDEEFIDRTNNQVITIKYNYQFDIFNKK